MNRRSRSIDTDILVVGGGVGGFAAGLTAARLGARVVVAEATDWIGGQLTSQGVPPDEHPWIESFGCTATYRAFRNGVRDYYRRHYPLRAMSRASPHFNPGNASVSKLAHEPRVALAVLETMIQPLRASERIMLLTGHRLMAATVNGDWVLGVTLQNPEGEPVDVEARYFIDATETGDLLPAAGIEYVTGFESRLETGEPAAPEEHQPQNFQAFTMCFAMDHLEGQDHTIDRPATYEQWKSYRADHWCGPQLGWVAPNPRTLEPQHYQLNPNPPDRKDVEADESKIASHPDLWLYRRILNRHHYPDDVFPSDICLVNWPMNDYWLGSIVDVDEEERQRNLIAAKQLSLSLLYWMQTEAPRPDGGAGFPGLRLRPDIMGTSDGLAKHPYVRESRRIRALTTITGVDVAREKGSGPIATFDMSVGIGAYRTDLHPSTGGDPYIDLPSRPFEIPFGALIPGRVENVLAGAKNIGTTHLSNGSYRLHPVEWNIGEAAGTAAAFCVEREGTTPAGIHATRSRFDDLQDLMLRLGIEVHWPKVHGY